MPDLLRVDNGLATLGPELVEIRTLLDQHFLHWAAGVEAAAMLFPPLMRMKDLAKFDYFQNFPHLAIVATRIESERLADYAKTSFSGSIPRAHLTDADYALPSAACYHIYLHLADSNLPRAKFITTVQTCFRNENEFVGLRRMWGFSMREIVCVGDRESVGNHLSSFKKKVGEFASSLGLTHRIDVAADPFFQPPGASGESQAARALTAKLFPTKEEFVYGDSLAIASLNFHRNFFGERCGITVADQGPAFTGCVAFGIERWLDALLDRYKNDACAIVDAIKAACPSQACVKAPESTR
jgi:seryl-tRNA synthetase